LVSVAVEDLDGFGDSSDLVLVAADLVEDRLLLELGEGVFAGSVEPGVEAVVGLLPLGLVPALDRCGRQVVIEPVVTFVAQVEQATLSQQVREEQRRAALVSWIEPRIGAANAERPGILGQLAPRGPPPSRRTADSG
jgi:hypothetical protein